MRRHTSILGFSIIEMAVALSVIALLIGSSTALWQRYLDSTRFDETQNKLMQIQHALKYFRKAYNRLPCPADLTADLTSTTYGVEDSNLGTCSGANYTSSFVAAGALPVTTMGMNEFSGMDLWDNRITYYVDVRLTGVDAFDAYQPNDLHIGQIIVNDESGTAREDQAIYALVSHGENGHGAYSQFGDRLSDGATNTQELENCDCDSSASATTTDYTLVKQQIENNSNDPNDIFDDIVAYENMASFESDRRSLCLPGWIHVPRTTLPDDRVVPAFCVMQYEARKNKTVTPNVPSVAELNDSTNYPLWTNDTTASLPEAEAACRLLGQQYGVLRDSQYLAIASIAIGIDENWSGGTVGSGYVMRGHSDGSGLAKYDTSNGTDPYDGTGNSASDGATTGADQRRTLVLGQGQVIWDLVGNFHDYVYCDNSVAQCSGDGHGNSYAYFNDNKDSGTVGAPLANYSAFSAPMLEPPGETYDENDGIGRPFLVNASGYKMMRGGYRSTNNGADNGGLYSMYTYATTVNVNFFGFRCSTIGGTLGTAAP